MLAIFDSFDPNGHAFTFETPGELDKETLCRLVLADASEPLAANRSDVWLDQAEGRRKWAGEVADRYTGTQIGKFPALRGQHFARDAIGLPEMKQQRRRIEIGTTDQIEEILSAQCAVFPTKGKNEIEVVDTNMKLIGKMKCRANAADKAALVGAQ